MRHGEVPLAVNETCTKLAGTAPRRPASAKSVSLLGMNAKEEALLFYLVVFVVGILCRGYGCVCAGYPKWGCRAHV